jgi:hypothetical protein
MGGMEIVNEVGMIDRTGQLWLRLMNLSTMGAPHFFFVLKSECGPRSEMAHHMNLDDDGATRTHFEGDVLWEEWKEMARIV